MADPLPDPEARQTLLNDLLQRYLQPEVTRRIADGLVAVGTPIYMFQVLLPDDREPEVRINDEVGGTVTAERTRAIAPGEAVTTDDISGIAGYEPRAEDRGVPHLTAFSHRGGWSLVFEVARGHSARGDFLERARQFLATAREAAAAGRLGPFVDNAFSACELFAKAELLSSQPTVDLVLDSGRHTAIATPYHAWANLGNTEKRFAQMLNRLAELRGPGRYLDRTFALEAASVTEILEALDAMERHVTRAVGTDASHSDGDAGPQHFIAKRPLRAGQIVTVDDVTIYPPKTPRKPETE